MNKRTLGRLWLLALLPKLVLAGFFFNFPISLDDMYQYDMLARSLKRGEGFRWYSREDFQPLRPYYERLIDLEEIDLPESGFKTAHRGPGYPFFLSLIYRAVPDQHRFGWARIIQAALMAGLAPLTAMIAFRGGFSARSAQLAGYAAAVYPLWIVYPLGLVSENLFIPLLGCSYLSLLASSRPRLARDSLRSGILLGATMLTRSVVALFLPLSAWWTARSKHQKWTLSLLMFAVAVGLTLPWAFRNSVLLGKPTYLESSLGYNLFISYHPDGDGGFIHEIATLPLKFFDDPSRMAYTTPQAWQFIRNDPLEALVRVVRKTAFFLGVEDKEMVYFYTNNQLGKIPQPWLAVLYGVVILPWLVILALAPLGMLIHPQKPAAALSLLLVLGYTLPHLLVIAEPRFHMALVPILIPFAASAWTNRGNIAQLLQRSPWKYPRWKLGAAWGALGAFSAWYILIRWPILSRMLTDPQSHQLYLPY